MECKVDRRKAIQAYKAHPSPRGIFSVRAGSVGPVWVGSSPNLHAAKNGLWFGLRMNGHRNLALQNEWNRLGEDAFRFAVLEQLDDDICEPGVNDLLKEKRLSWLTRLNARAV